jgi:dTDP-4-dehydrorhamnose 3,5-epimerase
VKFLPTDIEGVAVIEIEPVNDERGFIAVSFSAQDFARHGLELPLSHMAVAYNHTRGTLRGICQQAQPNSEAKLVRCTRGAIFAVAADVREGSDTVRSHVAVELTAENRRALYMAPDIAHGFQTLTPDTEVVYHTSGRYDPVTEIGFRWDEPEFGICWPLPVTVVSDRDASWPWIRGRRGRTQHRT